MSNDLAIDTPNPNHLTPPLKWWGGKHYLAKRIIDLMPPHVHYVEAYAGGLAVLLEKDPCGVRRRHGRGGGQIAGQQRPRHDRWWS